MNNAIDIWFTATVAWIDAAHAVLRPMGAYRWRTPLLTDRVKHMKPTPRERYIAEHYMQLAPGA